MGKEYLRIENVKKVFKGTRRGRSSEVIAVDDISLTINKGETLALVGESGSGKTTLGKGILDIESFTSGDIFVEGYKKSITKMTQKEKSEVYNKMQIIFQDPYSSLNPRMSALDIVMEPMYKEDKNSARKKALEILNFVGISSEDAGKLSNTFSGGQRQRIGIARAVVTHPDFILCDEPTSALDASTQAQVINLLKDLQKEYGLTYLFISHNLGVVNYIADRIAVMYRGNMVELGSAEQIKNNAQHPYTKRLIKSTPTINPELSRKMFEEFEVNDEEFEIPTSKKLTEIEEGHFVLK